MNQEWRYVGQFLPTLAIRMTTFVTTKALHKLLSHDYYLWRLNTPNCQFDLRGNCNLHRVNPRNEKGGEKR